MRGYSPGSRSSPSNAARSDSGHRAGHIAILVFWTAALFFGIGLYAAPSNGLVYAALAFGGLSIAFAIFLIFEFGLPYTGLFRVPPAALEQAIEYMDK